MPQFLTENKNISNTQMLTETVDTAKLCYILENIDAIIDEYINYKCENFGRTQFKSQLEYKKSLKTILMTFSTSLKDGSKQVGYSFSKNCKTFGRQFPNTSSLQPLPCIIRNTISRDFYHDLDIVNCHPTVLRWYCETNHIECEKLSYYVDHRATVFENIIKLTGTDRDTIKTELLKYINGGLLEPTQETPQFYIDFYNEMSTIRFAICELNPELIKIAKKTNIDGSVTNMVMCKYENELLMIIKRVLEEEKYSVGVLVFDGLMVHKGRRDATKNKKLIPLIKAEIVKELGIEIDLKFKPMDDYLDIDDDMKKEQEDLQSYIARVQINELYTIEESEYITVETISDNENWCRDIVFPDNFRSIGIKLRLGGGKTSACIRYINEEKHKKVLLLSPRQTYASSITGEYNEHMKGENFVCYMDIKDKSTLHKFDRICCSMESLHYLNNFSPDLIIIDECQACLTQHTCVQTNDKNLVKNLELFKDMLNGQGTHLIWADAFPGTKTTNFINNLKIPTMLYDYKCKMVQRSAIEVKGEKEGKMDALLQVLCASLEKGEKNYTYVSSKKRGEQWYQHLCQKFPDKNFKFYHGGCSIGDVRTEWSTMDCILTTSTITVGINFDVPNYFHNIFISLSSASKNRMCDVFQSHFRVRHLIKNELYFTLDCRIRSACNTSQYFLKKDFEWIETEFTDRDSNFEQSIPYVKQLVLDNEYEHAMSMRFLRDMFFHFLQECNYTVSSSLDITLDEIDFEEVHEVEFDNIPFLNMFEAGEIRKRMRSNENVNEMDKIKLDKYFFGTCFVREGCFFPFATQEHVEALWKLWVNFGRGKIRQFKKEKHITQGVWTLNEVLAQLSSNCNIGGLQSKRYLQLEFIMSACKEMGLKHSHDVKTIIPNHVLMKYYEKMSPQHKKIRTIFNIRDSTKKTSEFTFEGMVKLMNSVFKTQSFTKLVKVPTKRITVKGKKISPTSDFHLQSSIPGDTDSSIACAINSYMIVSKDNSQTEEIVIKKPITNTQHKGNGRGAINRELAKKYRSEVLVK